MQADRLKLVQVLYFGAVKLITAVILVFDKETSGEYPGAEY
jgi:hypothetical protein